MAKRVRRRGIRAILMAALLLSSASAFGQEPKAGPPSIEETGADVPLLLASSDPRELAWATHLVGKRRLHDLAPALLDLLAEIPEGPRDDKDFAFRNAMHSLIELDAEVPHDLLLKVYKRYSQEVMYYLSRAPERHEEALLHLLREPVFTDHYFAAIILLASINSPRLAASILKDIELTLWLTVRDDGRNKATPGEGWGMTGTGIFIVPDGYPPSYFYKVYAGPAPPGSQRRELVASRRLVQPGKENGVSDCTSSGFDMKNNYVLEGLARLLNTSVSDLGMQLSTTQVVAWVNAAQFQSDVAAVKKRLAKPYRRLVRRCFDKDLISHSDLPSLKPKIEVSIKDRRKDRRVKLPPVSDDPQQ